MKALKLNESGSCAIIETSKGLVYTNCYPHYLDKFETKQAETNIINKEIDRFYSYFNN